MFLQRISYMVLVALIVLTWASQTRSFAHAVDPATQLLDAYHEKPDRFAGKQSMNGYGLSDFPDFYDRWKLVTVRYRVDISELRFVYANPIAWKALKAGVSHYPDGAVFGKIGFITGRDKEFTSSVIPSGAKRFQFMVRDKKKFGSTDGWGYVLLNGNGMTFNGNPETNSKACAACHRIAADRGYVFSRPAQFKPFIERMKKRKVAAHAASPFKRLQFKTLKRAALSSEVSRLLPSGFSRIRVLGGLLQKDIFAGTVSEIGPSLEREARKSGLPSVLVDEKAENFAFAYQEQKSRDCAQGGPKLVFGRSIASNKPHDSPGADEVLLKIVSYCIHPSAKKN